MSFLYGLIGAFLGAALGGATAFFFASSAVDGDGLGVFFEMVVWGSAGLIVGAILGVVLTLRILRYVGSNQQGVYAKRNNALLVSVCVLAVPTIAAALIWNGNQCQYPPSDQQLTNQFRLHRAEFDKLAQMKQVDKGLISIGDNWTQPDDSKRVGLSQERIAEYRQLLNRAGVRRGMVAEGPRGVEFICWMQGGATSSDVDKGYAYLAVPPKEMLPSLDNCRPDEKNGVQAYRHIEGCWYLYYDYLPG